MEKHLILLALPALLAACGGDKTNNSADHGYDLANLDTSFSPCEDFFRYSSGGWVKNNPIPETEAAWGVFHQLMQRTNERVQTILKETAAAEHTAGSEGQLVGDFWFAAMDSNAVETAGTSGLMKELARVDNLTRENFSGWLGSQTARGISGPLTPYVSPDDKRSSVNILQFYQSGLGLPERDYYLDQDSSSLELQEQYRAHISAMFELLGYAKDSAAAVARRVYAVEHQLAQGMMDNVTARNPDSTYNKLGLDQLQALTPGWDWNAYMKGLGKDFDTVIVAQPRYAAHLTGLMGSVSLEDWQMYFRWKTLHDFASYLPLAFVEEDFNFFDKTLSGVEKMKPRWKRMLGVTNAVLGDALGKLYVERYFSAESKARVEEMVENLRTAFGQRIEQLDWMSDTTKLRAKEKLKAFTYKIGFPEKWEDYSTLTVTRNDLLGNVVRGQEFLVRKNLEKLDKPVDRTEWLMPPHQVNAYYLPSNNEVVFPAAILQPPFFNPEADDALNYGAIGAVIGHEFSHGFDDQGSKYDGSGNLSDWWTPGDRRRFEERTNRLAEQYSAFEPLPGVFVNGQLTLGENIADLAGLTMAYYAYMNSLKDKPAPEPVDGFTHLQRFFLGWGQVWSTNIKDEALKVQVATDYHSPGEFRAKGPLRNLEEFHAAWGCSPGDPMYLEVGERVLLW